MSQLDFADDVLARLRERGERYDERAYLFVLAALEQYGLLSRAVLEHWGIRSTGDIGAIVFILIDVGLLKAQESDRVEDFAEVFAFAEASEAGYPWGAWRAVGEGR